MGTEKLLDFDTAVSIVKNAVKQSHLNNQPHVDLTLVTADKRHITVILCQGRPYVQ